MVQSHMFDGVKFDTHWTPISDGFESPLLVQWEFQDPELEVPTIYKAYVRANMAKNMVQHLHFRILKFPLKYGDIPFGLI